MFRMAQNEFVADTVGDHASLGLGSEHFLLEDLESPQERSI